MSCQKDIAKAIIEQRGDYVLAVKDNQQTLHEEFKAAFQATPAISTHTTIEKDHGRIEESTCSVIRDLRFVDEAVNWKALACIIMIISKRTIGEHTTNETRYYISSLKEPAQFCLEAIRSHWGIENRLHWV